VSASIKLITEPSVYLVGRQTVSDGELDRFLGDHGVRWESDSDVAGEVLAETSGRLCYLSFSRPRPGGNAAYLQHIKEAGHGCYDAETDVLTADGWKAWPDVTEADQIATIDPQTRAIQYQSPIRLVRYQHRGRMYRVESQGVDLLVTPDHKMLACRTTTREGRAKESYSLTPAVELGTESHAYLKSGLWAGGRWTDCPGRDVMAVLGFAIGDGSFSGRQSSSIRFHLRRERKIAWLKSAVSRLEPRGFRLHVDRHSDNYVVYLPDDRLCRDLFANIYDADREKVIPQSVLTGASRAGLDGLFEGLMQSDGHEGSTGDCFDTTSPTLAGQFQQLCLHLGFAANVCYTYGQERRTSSFGDKPLTRLNVIRRYLKPEVNKWSGAEGRTSWVEDWEGEVFCAEVPNHTLYVRRNGIPVWSGNSVLEHAVWNFVFTGVSRSLTHELVRHRSGTGFSQLSQRYVDESVAEYVEPDIIANDPELHALFTDAVSHAHASYVKLAEKLGEKLAGTGLTDAVQDRTAVRKAARQAARSVLPNATETKIFFTANARALRNVIEQRCSRHAEPEIRKLFNRVWEVMVVEAPNLFGDYEQVPLPDGTFELTTPYRKV